MGRKGMRIAALAAGILVALSAGVADAVAAQPFEVGNTVLRTAVNGSGKLKYASGVSKLTTAQKELILKYMDTYYDAVAQLEPAKYTSLFASDAKRQRQGDEYVLRALCEIRSLQKNDLHINAYSYTITVVGVTKQEDGDILVLAEEDCSMKFAHTSSTTSRVYNVGHRFLLTKSDGKWLLRDHRRLDSLTELLRGQSTDNFSASKVKKRMDTMLKNAKKDVSKRKSRGTEPRASAIKVDNKYKAKNAVSYARKWVRNRNRDGGWPDYGHWGGNCQNFVSQALMAGGIPMDTQSPGVWKWYGATPDNSFTKQGRSGSWSGVNEFLTYVKTNKGYGLVAHADAPYYSGEVGDIIHMAEGGAWRHTVMITKVIKDRNGNTVDYLVASNTIDLRDFPASAYYYTDQMLIKVYGWNDPPKTEADEDAPSGEEAAPADQDEVFDEE